ncbi:acetate/propionate family kinase [Candidatus Finniella inopinata]|uniref:Acetate kinase n=1 Tax=Candidatus Finniella inopinata TaxID=1696036 RepID=A0A4Q7DJF7_9PROT|nr:acetate/propionate family kinase [Candidatus Finniella inopinata]RZI46882.1 acetate/propionate family kinase [Candidatus Finniella inopinata]
MSSSILVFNAGSSSLKFSLFNKYDFEPLLSGEVENLWQTPVLWTKNKKGKKELSPLQLGKNLKEVMTSVLDFIQEKASENPISAVGHRVVHGGSKYREPVILTPQVIHNLRNLTPLAPLHQPHSLDVIEATMEVYKGVLQVACFDTSFHRTQPRLAELVPLPRQFTEDGIIQYGFHGLSYQYIASQLSLYAPEKAHGRVIIAHLGSGASLCAMKNLKSVATSMGFSALGGLMMGTRSGSIDPGIILHLLHEKDLSLDNVTDILYNKSGMLGVSGLTSDVRELLKSDDANAKLAIDLFCYITAKQMASLLPTLSGIDLLVFTAGIGENCPPIRKQIATYLNWLGVELDNELNDKNAMKISSPKSLIEVYVIPTNESLVIAKKTAATLFAELRVN